MQIQTVKPQELFNPNRIMSEVHQGQLVQDWYSKKYDNTSRFATIIAECGPDDEVYHAHTRISNFLRTLKGQDFINQKTRIKWDEMITPHIGVTIEVILKEMGEKNADRREGMVANEYQKRVWVLEGERDTWKTAFAETLNKLEGITRDLLPPKK